VGGIDVAGFQVGVACFSGSVRWRWEMVVWWGQPSRSSKNLI
jgi:hypothetical protein